MGTTSSSQGSVMVSMCLQHRARGVTVRNGGWEGGTAWPTPSIRDEHEPEGWVGRILERELVQLGCRIGCNRWMEINTSLKDTARVLRTLKATIKRPTAPPKDRCVDIVDIWKCVFGGKENRMQIVCTDQQLCKRIMVWKPRDQKGIHSAAGTPGHHSFLIYFSVTT